MNDDVDNNRQVEQSQPQKKHYTRPVLIDWGTFEALTQSAGWSGKNDGGRFIFTKTR